MTEEKTMKKQEKNEPDVIDELDALDEQDRKQKKKKKEALAKLLDEQKEKSDHVLAVKSKMGKTLSFLTAVKLSWIERNVGFAIDLPIWKNKKENQQIVIDEETLDALRQRQPDWSRQFVVSKYLLNHEHHKFPPILVVAWKTWVNDPNSNNWDNDRKATEHSVTEYPLDSLGTYIDLNCEETHFYALDGQHRLMAILGVNDLRKNRTLARKDKNGKAGKEIISLDDSEPSIKINSLKLQTMLAEESMGIEIIPAVLKGESLEDSLKRLRNIFVHVNMNAKPLAKGELALLDEDDGFSIVARRIMVKHELFKHAQERVDKKSNRVTEKSPAYTTLEALVSITENYLQQFSPYSGWKKSAHDFERPQDEELEKGVEAMSKYFDELCKIGSHNELIMDRKKPASDFRYYGEEKGKSDNILFWPITQIALAEAIGVLEEGGKDVGKVFEVLNQAENDGKLKLKESTSIWFGVLVDPIAKKLRTKKGFRDLCSQLFVHLLHGETAEENREELIKKFRQARIIDSDRDICIGLDGEQVQSNTLQLPRPW